jgi:branched-chain amino acid transport system substrate-binding protein
VFEAHILKRSDLGLYQLHYFHGAKYMKTKRSLLLVVLVMALTLTLGIARAQDAKVIKIASQSPLSGAQSVLGTAIRNAAELAVEQLSGPLVELGYTVEFVPFDDQATPDVGVANAQNLVNDPAILAVIGHLNSGVAIPSSEVYNANNLVMVSPANTNPAITDRALPTVNRICGRDDLQAQVVADFVSGFEGVESIYVLHDTTAYGQGVAEFVRTKAEESGFTVVGYEGTTEAANFDSIIQPILALNPDLIFFGGIYSQTGIFINQARAAGYTGLYVGPDGFDSSEFAQLAGEAGVGTYFTTVAGPATIFPKAAQFIEDYTAKFGEGPQPFAANSYDATGIALQAIHLAAVRTGDVPSRSLVASIVRATENYEGLTGTFTFDAVGDPEIGLYYGLQVISSDPAEWNNNTLLKTVEIPSPLHAAELELMGQ